MKQLKISQALRFTQMSAIDMNKPVMLWGPPGVGKSAMVRQLTDSLNALLVDIRLSMYDAVDLNAD